MKRADFLTSLKHNVESRMNDIDDYGGTIYDSEPGTIIFFAGNQTNDTFHTVKVSFTRSVVTIAPEDGKPLTIDWKKHFIENMVPLSAGNVVRALNGEAMQA